MAQYPSTPPPFPTGWYCLGASRELRPGQIVNRRFMGNDVVVFRTRGGEPCVMDAYCPHLGAHLGKGGDVCDETIRCPFHHFTFATDGHCTATGYGTPPPPSAIARTWPVRDVNGLLLAFHSLADEAPQWEIPQLDWSDYTPVRIKQWSFRGHPQETSENSVDLGHFTVIHGYHNVQTIRPAETDGPYLSAKYGMERHTVLGPWTVHKSTVEFEPHVYGFGYSLVDVFVKELGVRTRQFVLSTPTDEEQIEFRIGLSVKRPTKEEPWRGGLQLLPRAISLPLIEQFIFRGYTHDVHQDFPMWQNKRYVVPPALAQGDGPVGVFRRWAKQFYDDPPMAASA